MRRPVRTETLPNSPARPGPNPPARMSKCDPLTRLVNRLAQNGHRPAGRRLSCPRGGAGAERRGSSRPPRRSTQCQPVTSSRLSRCPSKSGLYRRVSVDASGRIRAAARGVGHGCLATWLSWHGGRGDERRSTPVAVRVSSHPGRSGSADLPRPVAAGLLLRRGEPDLQLSELLRRQGVRGHRRLGSGRAWGIRPQLVSSLQRGLIPGADILM